MFIPVGDRNINYLFISTIKKVDNGDTYEVEYKLGNGVKLYESFQSSSTRDNYFNDTFKTLVNSGPFVTINDELRNVRFITSVNTLDEGYALEYHNVPGDVTIEEFSTAAERDKKIKELQDTFIGV